MESKDGRKKRQFALTALGVLLLSEIVSSCLWRFHLRLRLWEEFPANVLETVAFFWIAPFFIVYVIENRDARSLGLTVPRERWGRYALYALAALVLPAFFVGLDRNLVIEFAEQIVYIALPEEVFHRGYLMTRLRAWLGDAQGLLLSSVIFGLVHITSRLSQSGLANPLGALQAGGQAFLGGILFGFVYLKTKNIWPGILIHLSTNAYLGRLIEGIGVLVEGIS
jgi:membrane protease YdiL (CAAX protease family)